MTRKDYALIANAISRLPVTTATLATAVLAEALQQDNPRFNVQMFTHACLLKAKDYDPNNPHHI